MRDQIYEFGTFRLDPRERRLTCDGRVIPLRGKVFDTLHILIRHAGRLARKDELMKAIWPDSVVEESNLEHNLSVLRKVLRQNNGSRKMIETVPRQGYRFVDEVRVIAETRKSAPAALQPAERSIFITERESHLQQLQLALQRAQSGMRQVVFLTGEAGIGKTTLVRKFLAGLHGSGPVWIGQGECLEQHGPGEAYMPVLEAFGRLIGQPDGNEIVHLLRHRAPTWLFQMPSAVSSEERLSLRQALIGLTQERMLREGVDALEAMAGERLVILVLEDLHWSDGSTLDFLQRVARGLGPARLLVVGTYRPAEAKGRSASVARLAQQLRLNQSCQEFPLDFLSEHGIAEYLQSRLGGSVPPNLARLLHQRTEGNPLFAGTLVNFWIGSGALRADNGRWILSAAADGAGLDAPDTLRQVIEEQVDQLPPVDRELVEAASAAGVEFSAAMVAATANRSPEEVEARCAAMAQRGQFLSICGRSEWPDGTVSQRFRFVHSLYRDVTYRRVPAGQRVRWHQRIGERLEQAFAGQQERIVAELAEHLQLARDAQRAIHYLKKAAQQCLERGAAPDAVFHLTRALDMLRRIPEQKDRARVELGIHAILAPALGASKGFGDAETDAAFRRAYELTRQLGEEEHRFPTIFGFAVMLEVRGQYRKAQEFMEKYLPQEEVRGGYMLEGLDLLACSRFHQGAFEDALKHAERGAQANRPGTHTALTGSMGEHSGLNCHSWMSLCLWFLGRPDQALERARRAVSMAEDPAYAYSRSATWSQFAFLHQLRRDEKATQLWAQRTAALGAEQGFPYREAVGKTFHGWAIAHSGQIERGIAELEKGIEGCRAAGAELDGPYYLALLAEAYILARDRKKAAATLREAIERVEGISSFFYEAELWRLQGQVHWALASDRTAAADCFRRALEVAQSQGAKSLELRAAVSMARLLRERKAFHRGAELLAPVYRCFAGAAETADLRSARLEIKALKANAPGAGKRAV